MNKTVNINLGGIFFHVDEEAYIKLKKYLDAIRNSLHDDPKGKDEIIQDIEIRISEILSERIKDVRQVVNVKDVDYIIKIMGKPEAYSGDETIFDDNDSPSSDKMKKKKLYRDPDDKFLGGVCSGIAHYLGIDPIWVRLFWLFFALTYGSGVLIYLLLWIMLPVAETTSQKLEMEGEDVTISTIEKKIKNEIKDVSNRFKEGVDGFTEEIKSVKFDSKLREGLQEVISVLGKILKVIFKNFGKLIGLFLIFVSGVVLLSLLISAFSVGSIEILGIGSNIVHYPPFFYDSSIPKGVLGVALIVLMGIPFYLLFHLGLKILSSSTKQFSGKTKWSFLGLWLLSLMLIIFAGIESNLRYINKATVTDKNVFDSIKNDTLLISLKNKDDIGFYRNQQKNIIIDNEEKILDTDIRIKIKPSDSDKIKIEVFKKASDVTVQGAKQLADEILYSYTVENNKL